MSALQKIDVREHDISERDVVELLNEKFDRLHKEIRNMKVTVDLKDREISALNKIIDASRDHADSLAIEIEATNGQYCLLLLKYKERGRNLGNYLALAQAVMLFSAFAGIVSLIGTFFM